MRRLLRTLREGRQPSAFQRLVRSGRITLGTGTYGEPVVHSWEQDPETRLRIGAYCSIAANVTIVLGGEHRTDWVTTSPLRVLNDLPGAGTDGHPGSKGDITIGNDVWIGLGSIILSGVSIGDGAAIGAGSVVAADVPAYAVVAGNPARLIRYRFPQEIREALQRIAWWNWPHDRVVASVDHLCSADVEGFVLAHDPAPRGST
jgi:acetyltransferase-like isoleucine patch superfamily enzyme